MFYDLKQIQTNKLVTDVLGMQLWLYIDDNDDYDDYDDYDDNDDDDDEYHFTSTARQRDCLIYVYYVWNMK